MLWSAYDFINAFPYWYTTILFNKMPAWTSGIAVVFGLCKHSYRNVLKSWMIIDLAATIYITNKNIFFKLSICFHFDSYLKAILCWSKYKGMQSRISKVALWQHGCHLEAHLMLAHAGHFGCKAQKPKMYLEDGHLSRFILVKAGSLVKVDLYYTVLIWVWYHVKCLSSK